jgi:hypothetical protein
MRSLRYTWLIAGLLIAAGCSDQSSSVLNPSSPHRNVPGNDIGQAPMRGVGTMGTLDEIKPQEQGLVLYQTGFDFVPAAGAKFKEARQQFAVGSRHNKLQVHVDDSTKVYLNGELKKVGDLTVGTQLLVAGRLSGSSLQAEIITDLGGAGPPPENMRSLWNPAPGASVRHPKSLLGPTANTLSLCMGQDLNYTDTDILDFQGCWGGPSASDDIDTPFIPLFCPLIGCFGLDRFTYTMALGGWGFAFPFEFAATSAPGLVYHIPGNVALQVSPLPATTGSFSFWGGIGMNVGLNVDFCSFFGCYDIYTFDLSAFSMVHQATEAGPLTGQRMDVAEVACPSIGLIPIEGVPIDPLELGICEDLHFTGQPFNADVRSSGATPPLVRRIGFGPGTTNVTVRPDAMSVGIRYDSFGWSPDLHVGLYFQLSMFSFNVYDSPTIPIGSGAFDAITTPFPMAGSVFTVATDPLSPVDDLRYLYHPTQVGATLAVAPAPTGLTLTSADLLVEGSPVTARLQEAFDGSPIAGQPVTIRGAGLGGTASVTVTGTTNASGIVSVPLPVGEYTITAEYAGAVMYLPSSDTSTPVYIYRPTTFVIWGGNGGGIALGGQYQFWGSGWARQVTDGAFGGNSSFQGFAIPLSSTQWSSPPANAGRGPESVPDLIGVIVTTEVQRRGSSATGNIAGHAVLRVGDPAGYRPDGGHDTWGKVRITMP